MDTTVMIPSDPRLPGPERLPHDTRLRRLRFRAWRRGFRELDLVLGTFADHYSPQWSITEVEMFEGWLDIPDQIFYAWLTGREPVPDTIAGAFFDQVTAFAKNYSRIAETDGLREAP